MEANIYDNDAFFEAYANMNRSRQGLTMAGEWHQLRPLFPDLRDKAVLDLGCGYGWHCKYAASLGASSVLGIDASRKMIETAKEKNADPVIRYLIYPLEEYEYPPGYFDLVISNLALHYIADLEAVYQKVFRTLKPGGTFLFNIEHPVFTAGVNQSWITDDDGRPLYWPVDGYYYPGERKTSFLGQSVLKYHHTLTQILNGLLRVGFRLEAVEEVTPPKEMMRLPGMEDEMRRPMMLLVKAAKQ